MLQQQSGMYVKSSVFGQKTASLTFEVKDLGNTKNLLLTFISKVHKGNLIVKLNGNEVFSGEITKENPEPLRLPENYLRNGQNTIEFEAEKPGWMFWRRNRHQMETMQLTADITDVSRRQSENIFIVSATEKSNVKRAIIRFTPDCRTGTTGKLNALINSHSIYYAVPDCGG
ncbi:TPA: hypothetical protein HA265_04795, partial [Candidatus Woesearchaeota archaeon]|nr:hypothetical protein [Candidatus Woesearchaeota archaeon]